MHLSRPLSARALAPLLGLAALGLAAGPVRAATLVYTLSGVTFNDGATATGSFNFNPTTQAFSGFSILTTPGTSDGLLGSVYTPATANPSDPLGDNGYFVFNGSNHVTTGFLVLDTQSVAASPGSYTLVTGIGGGGSFSGSGEFTPPNEVSTRFINAGNLVVTGAFVGASSPEPSSWALLGFTAFGAVGLMWKARRRTAVDAAV